MRTTLLAALCAALFAMPARADGPAKSPAPDDAIVGQVRALLSSTKESERKDLLAKLEANPKLDWPSVEKGLEDGPYYQKPMVTEFGERHSHVNLALKFKGADGHDRAFSYYLPNSYDPKKKIPVLFYLHQNSQNTSYDQLRGATAIPFFKDLCEKRNFMFVAPSTNHGAEWWTPEGERFVMWTLEQLKMRYSLDENRIALMGALDGGDSTWILAQEQPGTFSALLPMSSDPAGVAAMIRPLFLGTIDRMDVLMGVPGITETYAGDRHVVDFLKMLQPMFAKAMRISTAIYPSANKDFSYAEKIIPQAVAFALSKKRDPLAKEVDIETDRPGGQEVFWLRNDGIDPKGPVAEGLPSTRYGGIDLSKRKHATPVPKMGVGVRKDKNLPFGVVVTGVSGGALQAGLYNGDILVSIGGKDVNELQQVKDEVQRYSFGDEVEILAARKALVSEIPGLQKAQAEWMREYDAKHGKAAPGGDDGTGANSGSGSGSDSGSGADDGDGGESTISFGGGGDSEKNLKPKPWTYFFFKRYVKLAKPEPPVFVREDFGASIDGTYSGDGVKIAGVIPSGIADRAGLKNGDVIVKLWDGAVHNRQDLFNGLEGFKFDKPVTLTVRHDNEGERTVTVSWAEKPSGRVDVKWDKNEDTYHVLVRHVSSFTLYFTDKILAPGKKFHLFINGIPYQDLAHPETRPDYPRAGPGEGLIQDEVERMRRKRALVDGWKPDPKWALEDGLKRRDRTLVLGGHWTIDLESLKPGFDAEAKVKQAHEKEDADRLSKAREKYRAQSGG